MKICFFDTHQFEKPFFEKANERFKHSINYVEYRLTEQTASLACGSDCVCVFVNDHLNEKTLEILKKAGVKLIALRSAGFNNIDLEAAQRLSLKVVRVPEYSPYAVAEHATALILTLNRKTHKSYLRVHEGNFSLNGLIGFDLHGKTVGVIGTGKIGSVMAKIMTGFGCKVVAYDIIQNTELARLGVRYVELNQLFSESDIITLHVPLNPETFHLINEITLAKTRPGVMLINTGRGALIETKALIKALKTCHVRYAGLDVYEEEDGIFFEDLSGEVLQDDTLARLLTFQNVILTSHQGFLTKEALDNISATTLQNVSDFSEGLALRNEVSFNTHIYKPHKEN
jgi:D-lactate dehydrogenase